MSVNASFPFNTPAILSPASFIPDLGKYALLLDVDGTIVDLAPTPREVQVSPTLRQTLGRLFERSGGAVALVSGRPMRELDRMFAPCNFPAVGCHGAEIRLAPGRSPTLQSFPLDDALKSELREAASAAPGVLFEDKSYSLALHYRRAPEHERFIKETVRNICDANQNSDVEVLHGKFVVEIKPLGVTKGTAVTQLMKNEPFAGRRPIFVGDDATDESVFEIMPCFHGIAFCVGRASLQTNGHFGRPEDVRCWLERIAREGTSAAA